MQRDNCSKAKIKENIIYYVLIFLAVVATPILATPIARLFDWASLSWSQQGELRPFFVELFTAVFWLLEWLGFIYIRKRFMQKQAAAVDVNEEGIIEQEAAIADINQDKKTKKAKRAPKPLLPRKNVAILFLITVACIIVVTLQIGFTVKPFYELGDKTTYTKMVIKGGEVLRNVIKSIWIVSILKTAVSMMEELSVTDKLPKKYAPLIKWIGVCLLAIGFGVFEMFVFGNSFFWTYILFYVAFTAIYFFTEYSPIKSYLLICFIYIF